MDYSLTLLDANENAQGTVGSDQSTVELNRYPDPYQRALKEGLSTLRNHPATGIVLGNGSDEIIDLLIRIFCEPGQDSILVTTPTYGMYRVCADINQVRVQEVSLQDDFELDPEACLEAIDESTKILFLCSPNNPTGNTLSRTAMERVLNSFQGIVVIDEAYIDFSQTASMMELCPQYPNLLVMHTFSKSWGLAGIRLGVGYTSADMVHYFNRVKPPYNINQLTQQRALDALSQLGKLNEMVTEIIQQRDWLSKQLGDLAMVQKVFPSQANFLLVRFNDPKDVFDYLIDREIIVRDRSTVTKCHGCLRISVGTHLENRKLINALKEYQA